MGQQRGTAAGCSAPVSSSLSLPRGRAHAFIISPPTPPFTQVLAPAVPTSELLLSSLLMTATSSPVPVGVISKPDVGNTQYKYGVLISPLRGAGSGNPGVMPSPPSSPCPATPRPHQPPARLLPAASPLPGCLGAHTWERAVSQPQAAAWQEHTPIAQREGTQGAVASCSGDEHPSAPAADLYHHVPGQAGSAGKQG